MGFYFAFNSLGHIATKPGIISLLTTTSISQWSFLVAEMMVFRLPLPSSTYLNMSDIYNDVIRKPIDRSILSILWLYYVV